MVLTKLRLGMYVATAMLSGGAVVYYNHATRPATSGITIEQGATFFEAIAEHNAARGRGAWPFTTNGLTACGWGAATNVAGATNWSFNGFSTIPLFGSGIPRQAWVEALAQVQGMVTGFVDRAETNETVADCYGVTFTNKAPAFVMLTVTGVWARLGIGDGTNKWTVGISPAGVRQYGTNIGSGMSTVTLAEAWAVLNVCTQTQVSGQMQFLYDTAAFQTVTAPAPLVAPYAPEYPAAYSDSPANEDNAAWALFPSWNVSYIGNPFYVVESVVPQYAPYETNSVYDYARLDATGVVWFADFPTNTGCRLTTWLVQSLWPLDYGNSPYDIAVVSNQAVAFSGLSTNALPVVFAPPAALGNWGAFMAARGMTFDPGTNSAATAFYVLAYGLATWDFMYK
jgi:hypothetical protein